VEPDDFSIGVKKSHRKDAKCANDCWSNCAGALPSPAVSESLVLFALSASLR
jgi:hypothetical protein